MDYVSKFFKWFFNQPAKRIFVELIGVPIIMLAVLSAANAAADCFKWAPQTVNLTGQISELPYSGESFFVEHNGKRQVLVLELATPICVDADKETNREENIWSLQMEILTHSPPFKPKWLTGRVVISGTLVPSSDHRTKAQIEVWEVTNVRNAESSSTPHPLGVDSSGLAWGRPNDETNIGRGFLRPGLLTEQQARTVAAQWVRGPMFAADRSIKGPAADKSLGEVESHLWLSLLVVRGDTGYCGVIQEPTWIFMWNSEESAAWFGGYPVMINARSGKVLDCRS